MSFQNDDYTVAWVSALSVEFAAARALLDDEHDDLSSVSGDPNVYILGRMGKHNVVIATLPDGTKGNVSAANVATSLLRSFPNIRFGVMVGVGGAAPHGGQIRLGDVVVSLPEGSYGGVVKYDFGASIQTTGFHIRGSLNKPPQILMGAVSKLRGKSESEGYKFMQIIDEMFAKWPRMKKKFQRPEHDLLFEQDYIHNNDEEDCTHCTKSHLVERMDRSEDERIQVHYGLIGSADRVIRDAKLRDKMQRELRIKCFEMEAAGLMDNFPCVVIRGISDYADTHKNAHWQPYASVVAGAFAKELLSMIPLEQVRHVPQATEILDEVRKTTEIMSSINQNLQEVLSGKDNECLRHLRQADPGVEKDRIEALKGGLLYESYVWINNNENFKNWRNTSDCKLLWISGEPGKGKTMLLCGIINELKDTSPFYFLFQLNDNRLNTGTSALRGLMFTIIQQHPAMIQYVREVYDSAGSALFVDDSSWYSLSKIFTKMLADPLLNGSHIIIDALDECVKDKDELLQLVVRCARDTTAKWIISSRPWPDIKKQLSSLGDENRLSLELNAASIKTAVGLYINHKVDVLAKQEHYDGETKKHILEHLHVNANDTFLWVALVIQYLTKSNVKSWRIDDVLRALPPGLDELYQRMLSELTKSLEVTILRHILTISAVVFRPLTITELKVYLDESFLSLNLGVQSIKRLIEECGSFLRMQGETIQFVHSSAQEYILTNRQQEFFPKGRESLHHTLFCTSVKAMSERLYMDMYNLQHPGTHISTISPPDPNPLQDIGYSCTQFLNHLAKAGGVRDHANRGGLLQTFMLSYYIYWLEAMSLLQNTVQANMQIANLYDALQIDKIVNQRDELTDLAYDMFRFVATFATVIQSHPLQIYCSGLLFAPQNSKIRKSFWSLCRPSWIDVVKGSVEKDWPHLLRNFEGNDQWITCLAFSRDGKILATGAFGHAVKLWSPSSGALLASLQGHLATIRQTQFSHDCSILASTDARGTIMIWSTTTAMLIKKIDWSLPDARSICAISFLHPKNHLVASRGNGKIEVFDALTGTCLRTWNVQEKTMIVSLRVSHDGLLIIYMSLAQVVLYSTESGILPQVLGQVQLERYGIQHHFSKVDISDDDRYIAWNTEQKVYWFDRHWDRTIRPIRASQPGDDRLQAQTNFQFLPDASCLGILRRTSTELEIFDLETGEMRKRIPLASDLLGFAFSPNTSDLVCAAMGPQVALWDLRFVPSSRSTAEPHGPSSIHFMPCGDKLVVLTNSDEVRVVDIHNQTQVSCIPVLSYMVEILTSTLHPSGRMALGAYRSTMDHELWYIFNHSQRKHSLDSFPDAVRFSPSGDRLLVGLQDGSLIMFDTCTDTLKFLWRFFAHDNMVNDVAFLADGRYFLSATSRTLVKLWKSDSKTLLRKIRLSRRRKHMGSCSIAVSPDGLTITVTMGIRYATVYEWQSFLPKRSFQSWSPITRLSYDESGEFFRSGLSTWKVDPAQSVTAKAAHDARKHILKGGSWIYQDGRRLLWIVPSYNKVSAIRGNIIALGHQTESEIMVINVDWFSQQSSTSSHEWWMHSGITEVTYEESSQDSSEDDDDDDDDDDDEVDEGEDDDDDDDDDDENQEEDDGNDDEDLRLDLKRKRASTLSNYGQEHLDTRLEKHMKLSDQ